MRKVLMVTAATMVVLVAVMATQVGLFVVPAGAAVAQVSQAAPLKSTTGTVYVVTRGADMRFVDSADAICRRQFSRNEEGCRELVRSWVMREVYILGELPYSETLWRLAAGGA